jgi:WD40 repeat protein
MVDEIFAPQRRSVTATRFSPSNDLILFGTGFGAQREGTVYVWDFAANAVRAELTHDDWIRDIVFTPRGDKFLSASCGDLTNRPGRLRLFDANQFVPLEMKFDDDGHLRRLSVSPDGEVVAGASKGKDLTSERGMTWLLKNGQLAGPPLEDPASHREFGVYGVAFSADGSLIFTGNGAGRVVSYGNRTGRITGLPIEHIKGVREVKVSRDNQRILTVCESQTAHVWDAATRTPVGQVLRHLGPTTTADISSDGGYYAVGGVARDGAGEVRIWRSARRSLLAPPIAHPGSVSNFVIAADAKTVVTGGHLRVGIWDLATGKAHGNSLAMQEGVSFVALHPDGSQVLAAAGDPAKGGSQRWDMVSRSPLESFRRHPRFIYSCGYSPDGTTAFTASVDGVKFWTLPDWQEASPRVHDSLVTAVRFHPDGKSFLTAGMDKTVRHWDFASKKELFRWKFSSVVRTLAFTPDGRRFVTGNDDGILQFWRANHALADSIELRHPAEVVFVDFHPREPLLLTVCNDGKLRFWNFELQESVGPVLPNTTLARFLPDGTATMRAARNGELTLFQHPESNSITAFTICEAMEAALGVTLGPSALSVLTAEEWRSRRNELTIPDRHR